MDLLGPWHRLIVAAIFVMLFGAKRLPDAARSLGKSARILKSELKDMKDPAEPSVPAKAIAEPMIEPPVIRPTIITPLVAAPDDATQVVGQRP